MKSTDLLRLQRVREDARTGRARAIRLDAGVTQAELAEPCGVSQAAVAAWESGRRVPRGEPAIRYAELLELLSRRTAAPR